MSYGLIEVLELLRPWDPVAIQKIRVGGGGDGGYVLLDQLRPDQLVFSYGVGPDTSFDRAMAEHGMRVLMYDHTVPMPADLPPNCTFYKEGIGPQRDAAIPCDTLASHVERHAAARNDLILKMDVEGAEWHSLLETPDEILSSFEQIVMEVHSLESLAHAGGRALRGKVFEKLNRNFRLFHVHSNNSQDLFTVEGLPVTNLLEVSYARLDICGFVHSSTVFPTVLDAPCWPQKADHKLWFFPFVPRFDPQFE